MRKGHIDQHGFSVVEGIIIVVVVIIIAAIGWWVYQDQGSPSSSQPYTSSYAGWKTYCDKDLVGCVKYPPNWKATTEDTPGTSYVANVQFVTPSASTNPVDVNYNLAVQGPSSVSANQVINKYSLNKPMSGDQVDEGIIASANAPFVVLATSNGNENFTKKSFVWSIMGAPLSTFATRSEATAWFNSSYGKETLMIIESFTYQ